MYIHIIYIYIYMYIHIIIINIIVINLFLNYWKLLTCKYNSVNILSKHLVNINKLEEVVSGEFQTS